MLRIKLFLAAFFSIVLISCEREMKIDLPESESKLVVEGAIENGTFPIVRLSRSIGFFAKIDTSIFFNSFVSGAHISVSDDSRTITLKEYKVSLGTYTTNFYTVDTADLVAMSFVGIPGKSYTLIIESEGKTYTATTSIPALNYGLDSFWSELPTSTEDLEIDSTYRVVKGKYRNTTGISNKLRLSNAINGGPFYFPYFSIYDDAIVGDAPITIDILPGWDKFDTLGNNFQYFHLGDTIDIKTATIDNATYEFYRTLETSYGSVGNPFAAPIIVTTNIEGGALGVWAGYGAVVKRLIVKDE